MIANLRGECQFVDATISEISSRMAVGPKMREPVGMSPITRRSVGKQAPRTIRGRNSSALRLRQQPRRRSRVAEEDLYHCNRRSVLHYELVEGNFTCRRCQVSPFSSCDPISWMDAN